MTSQTSGDVAPTLAANVRLVRQNLELTQREFAARLDVESGLVSKWERGAHRPSDANLHAIAHHGGVTIAWLYTDHAPRVWHGDSELPAEDQRDLPEAA